MCGGGLRSTGNAPFSAFVKASQKADWGLDSSGRLWAVQPWAGWINPYDIWGCGSRGCKILCNERRHTGPGPFSFKIVKSSGRYYYRRQYRSGQADGTPPRNAGIPGTHWRFTDECVSEFNGVSPSCSEAGA